jgi:hypothetical protein
MAAVAVVVARRLARAHTVLAARNWREIRMAEVDAGIDHGDVHACAVVRERLRPPVGRRLDPLNAGRGSLREGMHATVRYDVGNLHVETQRPQRRGRETSRVAAKSTAVDIVYLRAEHLLVPPGHDSRLRGRLQDDDVPAWHRATRRGSCGRDRDSCECTDDEHQQLLHGLPPDKKKGDPLYDLLST